MVREGQKEPSKKNPGYAPESTVKKGGQYLNLLQNKNGPPSSKKGSSIEVIIK